MSTTLVLDRKVDVNSVARCCKRCNRVPFNIPAEPTGRRALGEFAAGFINQNVGVTDLNKEQNHSKPSDNFLGVQDLVNCYSFDARLEPPH
jgi:hypothetical protein